MESWSPAQGCGRTGSVIGESASLLCRTLPKASLVPCQNKSPGPYPGPSTSSKRWALSHTSLFAVPTASGPLHSVPPWGTHGPQPLAVSPSPPSALPRCRLLRTPSPATGRAPSSPRHALPPFCLLPACALPSPSSGMLWFLSSTREPECALLEGGGFCVTLVTVASWLLQERGRQALLPTQ